MAHDAETTKMHWQEVLQALVATSELSGRMAEQLPRILDTAMALTGATGAAFGRVDGDAVAYDFTAGSLTDHAGVRMPRDANLAKAVGAASALAAPVAVAGVSVGVLVAVWRTPNALASGEKGILSLLGSLVAGAIDRQLLRERREDAPKALAEALQLAERREAEHLQAGESDPLTGLANHRALEAALRIAVAHWSPEQGSAVLFIGLDGFNRLNERYGHAAGDAALQRIAAILRRCTRSHDLVARMGSDEFVVLLNRLATPALHAAVAAERILDAVLADNALNSELPQLRLGIGAALVDRAGLDADAVMAEADRAMYAERKS